MKYRTLALIVWPALPSCTADDADFVLDTVAFGAAVAINKADMDGRTDKYVSQGYSEASARQMAELDRSTERLAATTKEIEDEEREDEMKRLKGPGAVRSCADFDYDQEVVINNCRGRVNGAYCVFHLGGSYCLPDMKFALDSGESTSIFPPLEEGQGVYVVACADEYDPEPYMAGGMIHTNCKYWY